MNLDKREKALNAVREKYGLAPGFRQPDPVILWQKGLWKPKPSKKDGESRAKKAKPKPKGKSGENKPDLDDRLKVEFRISKSNSDRENETVEWTDLSEAEPKTELSVEAQVDRLERRMEKHVAREEYEKAAKLRDQIVRIKNK